MQITHQATKVVSDFSFQKTINLQLHRCFCAARVAHAYLSIYRGDIENIAVSQ